MSRQELSLGSAVGTALVAFLMMIACGSSEPAETPDAGTAPAASAPRTAVDSGRPDTGPRRPVGPPKRIFAKRFVVNVRTGPNREALRIGYLRAGAVLQAKTADPVSTEGCRGGWFELTTGGFVCNGRDVIAFDGRRMPERRPAQPDFEAPLPYRYARTRRDNTPMYRRLPSDIEAAQHEGYRIPGMRLEHLADGGVIAVEDIPEPEPATMPSEVIPPTSGQPAVARETTPATAAGSAPVVAAAPAATAEGAAPTARAPGAGAAPAARGVVAAAAPAATAAAATTAAAGASEEEEERVILLEELQGARESVLHRRLVKGFVVSLDRDMRTRARRYWRTLSNGFIPYATQVEVHGSEFHGVELAQTPPAADAATPVASPPPAEGASAARPDGESAAAAEVPTVVPPLALPLGYVMSSKTFGYTRGRDGRPRRSRAPGYHHVFGVAGMETHRDREYVVATDGSLFERRGVTIIEAHDPPSEIGLEDKWIEVDLTNQSLVAYEGRRPVFATLVSTGRVRDPDNPLRDFRTPTGVFRVTSKHVTNNMDGDHAIDGPYSLEDVPYVMYFHLAYAMHSAFWHDGFGRPRSHGCVNLAPLDARWIFNWAGPPLPALWHGAYPTEEQPGTWIWIHGETPEG